LEEENRLLSDANTPAKIVAPARPFTVKQLPAAIRILNPEKVPDYDLHQDLEKLPEKGI